MPHLHVRLPFEPSVSTSAAIADELTKLTARLLGKKPELTAVVISGSSRDRWFIGSKPLSGAASSFYLEIKITEGTNTKEEKARYIAAVFESMTGLLGKLEPASYAVIHEVHADAWGYSGQTQEFRWISGRTL